MTQAGGWRKTLAELSVGQVLAGTAIVWFVFVSLWGIFTVHGEGHLGNGLVANVMAGENPFRWKTPYPSWGFYTFTRPREDDWLCSHPYGMLWMSGLFVRIFGHHDWVAPLPAVIMSALTPILLYGALKKEWGTVAAGAAAWGFAALPLTIAYAKFNSLEVFTIFGCVLFFWGHVRHQETNRRRFLIASILGAILAGAGDWPGFLAVGALLAWALVRVWILPATATPPIWRAGYQRWWALSAGAIVLVGLLWLGLFYKGHRFSCLLTQATTRSAGAPTGLLDAFELRKTWIDASFLPLPVFLGKWGFLLALARAIARRRDAEIFTLGVLFAARFQYVTFPNGADVHPFWPHYFGLYFALVFGQIVATATAIFKRGFSLWLREKTSALLADRLTALFVVGFLVVVLPDAVRCAWFWRARGGNYDMSAHYDRDLDSVLEQVVRPGGNSDTTEDADPGAGIGSAQTWAVGRQINVVGGGPKMWGTAMHWFARGSAMSGREWKENVTRGHVQAFDDVWVVDTHAPAEPPDAYRLREERASPVVTWLWGETEPRLRVERTPNPWLTWELRVHTGQPAVVPNAEPIELDEKRIAYDIAIETHDDAHASARFAAIESAIDTSQRTMLSADVELLGIRRVDGILPHVEIWIRAVLPQTNEFAFSITSRTFARRKWSFLPTDDKEQVFPRSAPIPPTLWRPGFVYTVNVPIRPRASREKYTATWQGATFELGSFP